MSGRFARVRRLSFAQWVVLIEAVCALAIAAFLIFVLPFRYVLALVRRDAGPPPVAPSDHAARIGQVRWAVIAAARRLPWRAKCFEQGLATHWMLFRRGVASEFHYGIGRPEAGTLAAHVWITTGGVPVVGGENAGDFLEIDCFAAPR